MAKATGPTSASTLIDGLLMVEPEFLEPEGECVGGTYRYHDRLETALPILTGEFRNCIALDLETGTLEKGNDPDAFSSPIYLLSICTRNGEAHVFDLRMLRYENEEEFLTVLRTFLRANRFVCHNGFFEQAFLMAQFGVMIDVHFDTMLVSQILTAGLRDGNGLDDCYKRWLDLELPKDDRKFFYQIHPTSPLTNRSIQYAAGDVTRLKEMASSMTEELMSKGLLDIWEKIEKPFLPLLTRAHLFGVRFDYEMLEEIKKELEDEINAVLERWGTLVGINNYTRGTRKPVDVSEPYVSITSWQQLTELFYGLGVEVEDTSEETLEALLESRKRHAARDVAEIVLGHRKLSKVLGTYVKPLLGEHRNRRTDRVHPGWKQMVDTGRMACREPNLQNVPSKGKWSKIRQAVVADPGYTLIIADYSQMELRVLAQLSQEPKMLEAFNTGGDLHTRTACALNEELSVKSTAVLCMWAGIPTNGECTEILRALWIGEKSGTEQAALLRLRCRDGADKGTGGREGGKSTAPDKSQQPQQAEEATQEGMLREMRRHGIPCGASPGQGQVEQRRVELRDAMSILPFLGASTLYELDERWKPLRAIAKTIGFGTCYGAGPGTIAREASISIRQARQLLDRYFGEYPTLKEYLDRSQQHAKDYCVSVTPAGRKRRYERPDPNADNYEQQLAAIGREGCNAPIQGCNADATKQASVMFRKKCIDAMLDAEIILWVHDEIVVQAPIELAAGIADLLRECMVTAAANYITSLPVEVSVTISERWTKD